MENSRKNAVVMFSDVVGYTAIMGENETVALTLLQKYHQIQKSLIERHHGTFVKEIGDGLLAYFPTADDATACAHAIQRSIGRDSENKLRIGLNQAEIILEGNDIFGDGVNIASRIEALADPGGVFFSAEVGSSLPESTRSASVLMGKAKLKNVKAPVTIYAMQGDGLPVPSRSRFQRLANPRLKLAAIPALVIFLGIVAAVVITTARYYDNQVREEEARNSLGEIEKLAESSWRDYGAAYDRAMDLQKIIPDDPKVQELINKASVMINIDTEPPGAEVSVKRYNTPDSPWERIGITPIDSVTLPIAVFRWRIEKEGFEPVAAAETTFDFGDFTNMEKANMLVPKNFFRRLDTIGSLPTGMTRISGSTMQYGAVGDFFIDKHEVTNAQYKAFVDGGGYESETFWENEFIINDERVLWAEAMEYFKDKTGQPGPSTWENGTYPEGQESFPVTGVCWYEARAYARSVQKDLPTGDHWGLARGDHKFIIRWPQMGGFALFAPFSNFSHRGPSEVGSLDGITSFGAYDMAGNAREWCLNDSPMGKLIRGGAWNSNTYEFGLPSQAPPDDRSETNGFRCALYLSDPPIPDPVYRIINIEDSEGYKQNLTEPVSDEAFKIYRSFFDYDDVSLDAEVVRKDDSNPNWTIEKVVFQAAYNNEQIIGHLFLPKNAAPPYQTVIYGPGTAAFFQSSSDRIDKYYEFPVFLDFIVRSGRAVFFPVCQGTFERRTDVSGLIHLGSETNQYTEFLSQVVKDYRRSLDYLETRDDIDDKNISFFGMSWGPIFGTILSAVENRIKTNVFISGGLHGTGRPEVNIGNFVTRVTSPTLMVNGRFDSIFPLDLYIMPLYNNLGTPAGDKRIALFDTDHIPPREEMISETLTWFDKYMGPVNLLSGEAG